MRERASSPPTRLREVGRHDETLGAHRGLPGAPGVAASGRLCGGGRGRPRGHRRRGRLAPRRPGVRLRRGRRRAPGRPELRARGGRGGRGRGRRRPRRGARGLGRGPLRGRSRGRRRPLARDRRPARARRPARCPRLRPPGARARDGRDNRHQRQVDGGRPDGRRARGGGAPGGDLRHPRLPLPRGGHQGRPHDARGARDPAHAPALARSRGRGGVDGGLLPRPGAPPPRRPGLRRRGLHQPDPGPLRLPPGLRGLLPGEAPPLRPAQADRPGGGQPRRCLRPAARRRARGPARRPPPHLRPRRGSGA
jgi:hypothetical protein